MQTFTIFPKEGEPFEAQIYKIEVSKTTGYFSLYDDAGKESYDGYLSSDDIAAIIPKPQHEYQGDICFLVYLRNRSEPLKVYASTFRVSDPGLVFGRHKQDIMRRPYDEYTLEGIYIATSEVIAVIPADGLLSYRD